MENFILNATDLQKKDRERRGSFCCLRSERSRSRTSLQNATLLSWCLLFFVSGSVRILYMVITTCFFSFCKLSVVFFVFRHNYMFTLSKRHRGFVVVRQSVDYFDRLFL